MCICRSPICIPKNQLNDSSAVVWLSFWCSTLFTQKIILANAEKRVDIIPAFLANVVSEQPLTWISKFKTSSLVEALSTFIWASGDPKGETQLRVAKSTKVGILIGKTKPKHFPDDTKTILKKSRKRLFWFSKWSKMTPQIGQNEQIVHPKSWFSGSFIDLCSSK